MHTYLYTCPKIDGHYSYLVDTIYKENIDNEIFINVDSCRNYIVNSDNFIAYQLRFECLLFVMKLVIIC